MHDVSRGLVADCHISVFNCGKPLQILKHGPFDCFFVNIITVIPFSFVGDRGFLVFEINFGFYFLVSKMPNQPRSSQVQT